MGDIHETVVSARMVFRPAVEGNAYAVILAHNHPFGDCGFSPGDRLVTKVMLDAGRLLGIPVLDHVVVYGDNLVNMREVHPKMTWP